MKHNPDLYRAYLTARDLSQDLLMAYSEDLYRGNGVGVVRTQEIDREFSALADHLGFDLVKRGAQAKEAAE